MCHKTKTSILFLKISVVKVTDHVFWDDNFSMYQQTFSQDHVLACFTHHKARFQAKKISDMIMSIESERPRFISVLWDLGIVQALSRPLLTFKHLILKTVFLLIMASRGPK